MVTLSFELSTTACVWGTRTTWWSNAAVGSHTRAGSLWLSSESSEMSLCVFCSLVGRVASLFPMPIRDLMNSRWGVRRTGWQEDSRTPKTCQERGESKQKDWNLSTHISQIHHQTKFYKQRQLLVTVTTETAITTKQKCVEGQTVHAWNDHCEIKAKYEGINKWRGKKNRHKSAF